MTSRSAIRSGVTASITPAASSTAARRRSINSAIGSPPRAANSRSRWRMSGPASDTRDDPLAHVAAQVQHQIADGIFVVAAASPYLLFAEHPQAGVDAAGILLQFFDRMIEKLALECVIHIRHSIVEP